MDIGSGTLTDKNGSVTSAGESSAGDGQLPKWWPLFILNVSELEYNSPEETPDVMLSTENELGACCVRAIEEFESSTPLTPKGSVSHEI